MPKLLKISFLVLLILFPCSLFIFQKITKPNITIVGPVQKADGLGRVTAEFIETINAKKKWNFYKSSKLELKDINNSAIKSICKKKASSFGKIVLVTEPIFQNDISRKKLFEKIRQKTDIKNAYPMQQSLMIALSMFESDQLPTEWVVRLNSFFDAVIVPDEYLVSVYKNSGVGIPIFVCPIALNLKAIRSKSINLKDPTTFTFGFMGSGTERKNVLELITCFSKVFKNHTNVALKINCRYFDGHYYSLVLDLIKSIKANNIFFSTTAFNEEQYLHFMSQINCLVNVSRGEGYSIQPREALAMGIPCILTDNTAQSKFRENKYVISIPCPIKIPFNFAGLKGEAGSQYTFEHSQLENALEEMYNNYATYVGSQTEMYESVKDVDFENIASKYLQIASPTFKYGKNNIITDNYIETNDVSLFNKAQELGLTNKSNLSKLTVTPK